MAIISLPACTYRINIGEPELPPSLVQPLPLMVGVKFDPALSDYEFVARKWGEKFRFEPGTASETIFKQALEFTFAETAILVSDETANQSGDTIDATVYVAVTDFFALVDPAGNGELVEITYTVTIEEPGNGLVAEVDFQGRSDPVAYTSFGESLVSKYYGRLTREAMFDAATRFMIEFRDSPDVQQWLHSKNAYRDLLGVDESDAVEPVFQPSGPASIVRVAIFSDRENFRGCLMRRLTESPTGIQVLGEDQIRNAFYPWMIDLGDPEAAQWLETNGAVPLVQERIAATGVTHIVTTVVDTDSPGYEEMWDGQPGDDVTAIGIPIIGPYGGVGIFGVLVADENTHSTVAVYALDPQAEDKSFEKSASGKTYQISPLVPVTPVMGKETDAQVCEAVANELIEQLHGEAI